jgi:hypothetical protein
MNQAAGSPAIHGKAHVLGLLPVIRASPAFCHMFLNGLIPQQRLAQQQA